jgi:oligopeptide/dipeptide ABC transporter ATP-binding protein
MYLGRIVESGTVADVFERPAHPYTEALLAAVPVLDSTRRGLETRTLLQGDPPNPANPPSGCRFRTRCPKAQAVCATQEPALAPIGETGAEVACHFPNRHGR